MKHKQENDANFLTQKESPLISSDRPVVDITDDAFDFSPFAKNLAQTICNLQPEQGNVMALYAPWGSGKSTLLNFIKHFIEQEPASSRPIVVEFNPWWFANDDELVRHFFEQLQLSLQSKAKTLAQHLMRPLSSFANAVSEAPIADLIPGGSVIKVGSKIASRVLTPKTKDIHKLKDEIASAIRSSPHRLLILIDDIDRLDPQQARDVFKVVKSIADFPNTTYVLAFDKSAVISSLKSGSGNYSEDFADSYLEKIVQVPFELPLPDKLALRSFLLNRLNAILGEHNINIDKSYWANLYFEGIEHFITTPRDAIRLCNSIAVTYRGVAEEVNPCDFIAIECIRIFRTDVYDIIRRNTEMFSGVSRDSLYSLGDISRSEEKKYHSNWLDTVPVNDKDAIKKLVIQLFPRTASILSNVVYSSDRLPQWRREKRVCSSDIFPAYFRLSLGISSISALEINTILSSLSSESEFSKLLLQYLNKKLPNGQTRARLVLNRVQDYTNDLIGPDQIQNLLSSLADIGDEIESTDKVRTGFFDFGIDLEMGRIMFQCIRRFDEPGRFDVLKYAFEKGNAIGFIVHEIAALGQEHGKNSSSDAKPEADRLLTSQHLNDLENLGLKKIRMAVSDRKLLGHPELPSLLHYWSQWGGNDDEIITWATDVTENVHGLVQFIQAFVFESASQSLNSYITTYQKKLDQSHFVKYLDLSNAKDRLRQLDDTSWLSPEQHTALDLFLREPQPQQIIDDSDY